MLGNVIRLIYRLMRDARVPSLEKLVFLLLIGYVLFPFDFVPDIFPLAGQVDDILLLLIGLRRLLSSAETAVLTESWPGTANELNKLKRVLDGLLFLLPGGVKGRAWDAARDKNVIDVEYRIEE